MTKTEKELLQNMLDNVDRIDPFNRTQVADLVEDLKEARRETMRAVNALQRALITHQRDIKKLVEDRAALEGDLAWLRDYVKAKQNQFRRR